MKKLTRKVHNEVELVHQPPSRDADQGRQFVDDNANAFGAAPKMPIVYSGEYNVRFMGMEKLHPFDAAKGGRILKYLKLSQLLSDGEFYEPEEITKKELLKVHTKRYLRSLKWSLNAAKISEIPPLLLVPNYFVQRGYLRPMRFQAAGSILAGKLALERGWAINLGGGFHHCCAAKGGGFCPYADITLLIRRLMEEEAAAVRRVMIIDLDAHQGNGHERDFMDNPDVYIVDVYNRLIYPRDQPAKLAIRCAVELSPGTGDTQYMRSVKRSVINSLNAFKPDLVVYNAGTDILLGDPLGCLAVTPEGVIERDEFVFWACRQRLRVPLVMLLSGGYLKSSAAVITDSICNLKRKDLLSYQC